MAGVVRLVGDGSGNDGSSINRRNGSNVTNYFFFLVSLCVYAKRINLFVFCGNKKRIGSGHGNGSDLDPMNANIVK